MKIRNDSDLAVRLYCDDHRYRVTVSCFFGGKSEKQFFLGLEVNPSECCLTWYVSERLVSTEVFENQQRSNSQSANPLR